MPREEHHNHNDAKEEKSSPKEMFWLCVGFAVLTAATVYAVILNLPPKTSPVWLEALDLPNSTVDAITTDADSPQARAFQWLQESDEVSQIESTPQWKKNQRFALATFYFSTGGQDWTNSDGWLVPDLDECTHWFYPTTISKGPEMEPLLLHPSDSQEEAIDSPCDQNGKFQILSFPNNSLHGVIPPEIALLTQLTLLELSAAEQGLTGGVPTELGLLTRLKRLFLDRNALTGPLPTECGLLTSLEIIDLGNNPNLTGPIPSQLGLLSNTLQVLSLHRTSLSGFVPTELFLLTNLQQYLLHQPFNLTGATLEGIGALSNLRAFVAQGIPYQSTIPTEIALLTNLLHVNLWNTQLTGTIPTEFWSLTTLLRIDLDDNSLEGTFPTLLHQLSQLQILWINGNLLTSTLPTNGWQHMKNLTLLNVGEIKQRGNQLTGTLPTELGLLTTLSRLGLHGMTLTGTIPTEFGLLSSISDLLLHNTSVAGTIPSEILLLQNLQAFTVSNTLLTGSIPDGLCPLLKEVTRICPETDLGSTTTSTSCDAPLQAHDFSCAEQSSLCGCSCNPCSA